jgi:hypothetical protein
MRSRHKGGGGARVTAGAGCLAVARRKDVSERSPLQDNRNPLSQLMLRRGFLLCVENVWRTDANMSLAALGD